MSKDVIENYLQKRGIKYHRDYVVDRAVSAFDAPHTNGSLPGPGESAIAGIAGTLGAAKGLRLRLHAEAQALRKKGERVSIKTEIFAIDRETGERRGQKSQSYWGQPPEEVYFVVKVVREGGKK